MNVRKNMHTANHIRTYRYTRTFYVLIKSSFGLRSKSVMLTSVAYEE